MKSLILFLKSKIPDGARWITIKPHGADEKGQPVLIQDNPDGSARVIGGAGNKLNYLKLKHVRSESEYKADAEKKRSEKTAAKKVQREKDKAAGIYESKKKAHEELRTQEANKESDFVKKVAATLGWDQSKLQFNDADYPDLSDAALNKLRSKFHRDLMGKALAAVDLQRQSLLADAGARMKAGIGEIPMQAKDDATLSVQDLDPIPQNTGGLGFSPQYKERAGDIGEEVAGAKEKKLAEMTEGQRQAAIRRGEGAQLIKKELLNIREPVMPDGGKVLAEAKDAAKLLMAHKELQTFKKKARDKRRDIEKSDVEPKAYLLEYTDDPELADKVAQDMDGELRTIKTRAFLSEFQKMGGDDSLGKYIGVGAYNSINSLALAVGGNAMVDRSVVDVLGVAGGAQVLARRIRADLSAAQADRAAEAMQDFHLNHYMDASADALTRAGELMEAAKETEIGEAANGSDLAVAQELNIRRQRAINDAQKLLGETLGEMETNAALVVAMKGENKGDFQVSLGATSVESAIQQVRAIGLQRGDYTIDRVAGNTFLTVKPEGMTRLAKPINRADIEQVQRNLSIIHGDQDEPDWLPLGLARRPDLVMNVKPGVAPRLAEPFAPASDLKKSLQDYIGGRAADGDSPADIVADIQSADFMRKVGPEKSAAYRKALDAVAPLHSDTGEMQRVESLVDKFDQYADEYVTGKYGTTRSPINKQKFNVDQHSVDALHRALAETPEGTAAYKQIGELHHQDQRALREFFYKNIAKESPESGQMRADLASVESSEPEKESPDMFGEMATNPEWTEWKGHKDALTGKVNSAALTWGKYIEAMRGPEKAYEAVQDLVRSRVNEKFAQTYNTLNPGAPIKTGKATIRNNLNHLDMVDPAAREARSAKDKALLDSLRERNQGKYAAGSVGDKMDEARAQEEAFNQSQMGFFSSEEAPPDVAQTFGADERHTLGHEAERQIAGMMDTVGRHFEPGRPQKIFSPTMSGGKNAPRQRLVKMIEANKRVVAAFGTGAGKTVLMMGAFTHLKEKGKVNRGVFLVPSIVQGEFGGAALKFLEPGKFNWHAKPGANRAERIAAYKDPKTDFVVMTHDAFRDDMIYLAAQQSGVSNADMSAKVNTMTEPERKQWMRELLDHEGINFDYMAVDESQNALNRQGKENSSFANVVDSMSEHTPYYVQASGDPVKNDASEIYDVLHKMDSTRYADRATFMRQYGVDTLASKDALRREMARYVYPQKIDPDTKAERKQDTYELSAGQNLALSELDKHMTDARLARMQGKVDVAAMRAISPGSFEGVPEDQQEATAKDLQGNIGLLRSAAIQRAINTAPDNAGVDRVASTAAERKGKPGVVFAHSLESVRMITERLEKEGHRVVTLTGADSAEQKETKRRKFDPGVGEAEADILVASDAGAVGMNAQRGQWLYQFDTPQTAMRHAQRNGRIYRTGQKNDVELIDGIPNHPEVRKARDRLQRKYGLRDLMTTPLDGLDESGVGYYLRQHHVYDEEKAL